MKKLIVKKAGKKGEGLFAARNFSDIINQNCRRCKKSRKKRMMG